MGAYRKRWPFGKAKALNTEVTENHKRTRRTASAEANSNSRSLAVRRFGMTVGEVRAE
jgi:hypothetical protein